MVSDITNATRVQYLYYGAKAQVNVRPSGRSGPARVADHVLNPSAPITGAVVLNGAQGSGLLSMSLDSAYKVLAALERLEAGVSRALSNGGTLAGDTTQPDYFTWENTEVTSGASNVSIGTYAYGDRSADIAVTTSYGLVGSGAGSNLVDGAYTNDDVDALAFNSGDAQGQWINFDFGAPSVVHEATWHGVGTDTQGTWVWQGSNDGATYFSLGSSFSLGGETSQVQDSLRFNTDGYQHYRLYGISGTTDGTAQLEVAFKTTDTAPAPASQAQILSAASLNVIDAQLAQGRGAIDNLVSAAEAFGVNLLSSASRAITLRATPYGGAITVQAQPLDSRALGLMGSRAVSQADAEDAQQSLQSAIAATKARIAALHTSANSLLVSKGALSGEVSRSGASTLPSGSLVNLLA